MNLPPLFGLNELKFGIFKKYEILRKAGDIDAGTTIF